MSSTVVTTGESTAIIINLLISLMLVALIGALIYSQLPRIEQMIKKDWLRVLFAVQKIKVINLLRKFF